MFNVINLSLILYLPCHINFWYESFCSTSDCFFEVPWKLGVDNQIWTWLANIIAEIVLGFIARFYAFSVTTRMGWAWVHHWISHCGSFREPSYNQLCQMQVIGSCLIFQYNVKDSLFCYLLFCINISSVNRDAHLISWRWHLSLMSYS